MQALRMQIRCLFMKPLSIAIALSSMPVPESFNDIVPQPRLARVSRKDHAASRIRMPLSFRVQGLL